MQIWAVARQMIAEGIRMKIALIFLLLIGMVVLGLPFSIAGDASLTGGVQSFMSYGFAATGVLLGMLTIFMSRSLSDEFVHRQILMVMVKPIPRWQFIVGKCLGIVCLNGVFMAVAGLCIYGMVYYIKATHPPIDDRYDEAELVDDWGELDEVVCACRIATESAVPLVLSEQLLLCGEEVAADQWASTADVRVVAVFSEPTGPAVVFKRLGSTLPGAPHVRLLESVGGLGESVVVRTEEREDFLVDTPLLLSVRRVLGVLYEPPS